MSVNGCNVAVDTGIPVIVSVGESDCDLEVEVEEVLAISVAVELFVVVSDGSFT